ncbi:MAG TPA: di-heme oxidoredictase family protein [Gemmatimonadaceae bacterium]|nr:di-heme oxidoredictase family protein [Gemmatimonadaceae bacterium]
MTQTEVSRLYGNSSRHTHVALIAGCVLALAACGGETPVRPPSGPDTTSAGLDPNSGGALMTVVDATSRAFRLPGNSLSSDRLAAHVAGDAVFDAIFVPAPAPVNPGLGPHYDNNSCGGCHTGDGRGRPPVAGDQFNSMIFRVSGTGTNAHGGPAPIESFGTQLELKAVSGVTPMTTVTIDYHDSTGTFGDGTQYSLRVPRYLVSNPYAPFPMDAKISPRVAPPNFGLGLLAAVTDQTILDGAAAEAAIDANVAGHANFVFDSIGRQTVLGRFGLKANMATLTEQSAAAASGDMGITSSVFPLDICADPGVGCASHSPELTDAQLAAVTTYIQTLAVPARRSVSATTVVRGEQLFRGFGCSTCHTQTMTTGTVAGAPEVSGQRIHPYTDLLLHDMGPGLADNRPDYLASGSEWRTPPLWGIGLTPVVNGHTNFLHDGRARNLLEAVMWHGGQATSAREAVRAVPADDRNALLAFLNSL